MYVYSRSVVGGVRHVSFTRALHFLRTVPTDLHPIPVFRKILPTMNITIDDIPGYRTSGTEATLSTYQGLFEFVHAHPYVITYERFPPASFTMGDFLKLHDFIERFHGSDLSLLFQCAYKFAVNHYSDYFPTYI